uniref:Uncharacterized protein n=1 Tax=Arundo donax TaxID=35708 RepID=A0A0A8YWN7_ARUDO
MTFNSLQKNEHDQQQTLTYVPAIAYIVHHLHYQRRSSE